MNQRRALTELGPDREALRERHRAATLFDLGLGALQVTAFEAGRLAEPEAIHVRNF